MKELLEIIRLKAKDKKRFVISIDGRAASGKSTLADYLQKELEATVFHMDDYFLPVEMKTDDRLSIPGGNVHYERMQQEILDNLSNESISFQRFDCQINELCPVQSVPLTKFIVIEGVYSQQEILSNYYDFTIFSTISKQQQFIRLSGRSPKLFDKFIQEWLPLEEEYFSNGNIEQNADYIISGNNKL